MSPGIVIDDVSGSTCQWQMLTCISILQTFPQHDGFVQLHQADLLTQERQPLQLFNDLLLGRSRRQHHTDHSYIVVFCPKFLCSIAHAQPAVGAARPVTLDIKPCDAIVLIHGHLCVGRLARNLQRSMDVAVVQIGAFAYKFVRSSVYSKQINHSVTVTVAAERGLCHGWASCHPRVSHLPLSVHVS